MAIQLGNSAVTLKLGTQSVDGYLGSTLVTPPPADPFATLVSTKSTGNIDGIARSTTGYIKVEWWDDTSNVYGTGDAAGNISWSKAAGAAGEKTIRIYPSDASGNLDGSLTMLNCPSNALTSLDASGCTGLVEGLFCYDNSLTSLDVSGLAEMLNLVCFNNAITSLDVSGCTALGGLVCFNNSLTSLDVSGLTGLERLSCASNALTSLDISRCTAIRTIECRYNALTSLRAQGVSLTYGQYYSASYTQGGVQVQDNQLSAAALNQFYADLLPGTAALLVGNNPGTTGDDPTIATGKGYTVYGS